jgi:hypothetical protein
VRVLLAGSAVVVASDIDVDIDNNVTVKPPNSNSAVTAKNTCHPSNAVRTIKMYGALSNLVFTVSQRSRGLKRKKKKSKINIETRRSTTPEKRVILVQGPC